MTHIRILPMGGEKPTTSTVMLLNVRTTQGEVVMVVLEHYLGKHSVHYTKHYRDRKNRREERLYLIGLNTNNPKFRRDVMGPTLRRAADAEGFSLVARGGYKNDRMSASYCCSSAGGLCPFTFQIYWDNQKNNWYIWASGTGNPLHSGHAVHEVMNWEAHNMGGHTSTFTKLGSNGFPPSSGGIIIPQQSKQVSKNGLTETLCTKEVLQK
jgi:hypothetical protein